MAGLRELAASLLDRRRIVVLIVLVGWAVVIGAGAGADPDGTSWLGIPALADLLVVVVGLLSVIGFLFLIAMLLSMRRGETELPARPPRWRSLVVIAVLLIIAMRLPRPEEATGRVEQPDPTAQEAAGPAVRAVVVGTNEILALLVVAVLAIGTVIWTRRRLAALSPDGDASLATALQPIIERASRRLEQQGDDPRSAVIAAYASLEDSLTELGRGRRRAETPSEHVERVLSGLMIDRAPVVALAELYEVARFSDHSITDTDRQRAATALHAVRDDLRAVAPGPTEDPEKVR
ncbi:MAG: DUF4129 domain-containing protein [Acidimicrobiia bacterium]|nr:DUF4129 domain-containing protein [Acidimicrobiia bacterium]